MLWSSFFNKSITLPFTKLRVVFWASSHTPQSFHQVHTISHQHILCNTICQCLGGWKKYHPVFLSLLGFEVWKPWFYTLHRPPQPWVQPTIELSSKLNYNTCLVPSLRCNSNIAFIWDSCSQSQIIYNSAVVNWLTQLTAMWLWLYEHKYKTKIN